MAKPDLLIASIDAAFQALLVSARLGGTVPEGDAADRPTLSEQVKAAEAAASWAERRAKIMGADASAAPKPTESRFGQVRRQFNGTGGRGGGSRASTEDEAH